MHLTEREKLEGKGGALAIRHAHDGPSYIGWHSVYTAAHHGTTWGWIETR